MSASGAAAGSPPGGTTSFTNPHATRFDLGDMGRSAPSAVAHGFGSMLFRGPQPKAGGGVRSTSAESTSGAKRGKGGKGRANGKASASAGAGEEESQDEDEDEEGSGAEEEPQQQQGSSSKASAAKGKGKRAPAASKKKGSGSAGAGSGSAPPSADKQMAYALASSGAPGAPAPMQRKHSGRAASSRKGKEKDQEMDDSDGDESAMGDGHQQGNAAGGKAQQQQQVSFEGLDASSQRKAQNRIAQREFRQRKQEYIRALECRVELLSSEHDVQVDRLRWLLRQLLVENNQLRAVLGLLSSFVGDRGMGGFLGNNPETREELTQLLTTTSEKTITDAWHSFPDKKPNEMLRQMREDADLPPEGLPESSDRAAALNSKAFEARLALARAATPLPAGGGASASASVSGNGNVNGSGNAASTAAAGELAGSEHSSALAAALRSAGQKRKAPASGLGSTRSPANRSRQASPSASASTSGPTTSYSMNPNQPSSANTGGSGVDASASTGASLAPSYGEVHTTRLGDLISSGAYMDTQSFKRPRFLENFPAALYGPEAVAAESGDASAALQQQQQQQQQQHQHHQQHPHLHQQQQQHYQQLAQAPAAQQRQAHSLQRQVHSGAQMQHSASASSTSSPTASADHAAAAAAAVTSSYGINPAAAVAGSISGTWGATAQGNGSSARSSRAGSRSGPSAGAGPGQPAMTPISEMLSRFGHSGDAGAGSSGANGNSSGPGAVGGIAAPSPGGWSMMDFNPFNGSYFPGASPAGAGAGSGAGAGGQASAQMQSMMGGGVGGGTSGMSPGMGMGVGMGMMGASSPMGMGIGGAMGMGMGGNEPSGLLAAMFGGLTDPSAPAGTHAFGGGNVPGANPGGDTPTSGSTPRPPFDMSLLNEPRGYMNNNNNRPSTGSASSAGNGTNGAAPSSTTTAVPSFGAGGTPTSRHASPVVQGKDRPDSSSSSSKKRKSTNSTESSPADATNASPGLAKRGHSRDAAPPAPSENTSGSRLPNSNVSAGNFGAPGPKGCWEGIHARRMQFTLARINNARRRYGRTDTIDAFPGMKFYGATADLSELPPEDLERLRAIDESGIDVAGGPIRSKSELERTYAASVLVAHQMDSFRRNPSFRLPSSLRPSEKQLRVPHDPFIDGLPFPGLRDSLIDHQHDDGWEAEQMLYDLLNMVRLHEGDALQTDTWELPMPFLIKYARLIDDRTLASCNKHRQARGESTLSKDDLLNLSKDH